MFKINSSTLRLLKIHEEHKTNLKLFNNSQSPIQSFCFKIKFSIAILIKICIFKLNEKKKNNAETTY